ncbi:MAG: LysR family transcriptional regulator [Gammaproteobacteria bacterium]|nr:LysR family transcriptional regulator [Gammaproteobacteria bacterium]
MQTLRNVNLNLLPVLHALVHHRNVTRAGEALNMSQSAVSDALAQLRHVFADELLIRSGRQMQLTDLAQSLIPQIDAAVGSIQTLLDTPDLDPALLNREFVVATADSVTMTIGPPLTAELMGVAPQVSAQFVSIDSGSLQQGKTGEVDLLIGPTEVLGSQLADYHHATLYDDNFVCIMRKGHPLAKGKLSPRDYWSMPHVTYRPDSLLQATLEARLMHREGRSAVDVAKVPQFSLLPFFVEATDCLAMVSRRVAERMQNDTSIVIRPLPPIYGSPVPISMFWNDIKHNDPAHRWFRDQLASLPIT